jgi:hypothetical protein
LEQDVLQDIVSEVFVSYHLRDQPEEQGAVPIDQHFKCVLIA